MKHGFDASKHERRYPRGWRLQGHDLCYFQNKEDLFAALINTQKQKFAAVLRDILAEGPDLRTVCAIMPVPFQITF